MGYHDKVEPRMMFATILSFADYQGWNGLNEWEFIFRWFRGGVPDNWHDRIDPGIRGLGGYHYRTRDRNGFAVNEYPFQQIKIADPNSKIPITPWHSHDRDGKLNPGWIHVKFNSVLPADYVHQEDASGESWLWRAIHGTKPYTHSTWMFWWRFWRAANVDNQYRGLAVDRMYRLRNRIRNDGSRPGYGGSTPERSGAAIRYINALNRLKFEIDNDVEFEYATL